MNKVGHSSKPSSIQNQGILIFKGSEIQTAET